MKIFYVITKSNFGGAQRYVLDLASYGKQSENDVSVITGGSGSLIRHLEMRGIRTISLSSLEKNIRITSDAKALFEMFRLFREESPDVVHVNSSKTGGLGAVAARVAGVKKIIFTAHGWPFNENRSTLARSLMWFFSWLTVLFSHKTITITKHDHGKALEMPWVKKKIVFIPNGIESFILETRQLARKKFGADKENDVWIGFVGELHNLNKGINYLLEAFVEISKSRKDVFLIIVGEGRDRKTLEEFVISYKLEKRVLFAGHVDNARTLLNAFDMFVLPSVKEGLPYVVLEAGVAGLPVIASRVGGIPDIIEDERSGSLVEPGNAKELAEKMAKMLEAEPVRKKMGEDLKANVAKNFSLKLMLEKTYSLYA